MQDRSFVCENLTGKLKWNGVGSRLAAMGLAGAELKEKDGERERETLTMKSNGSVEQ